MHQSWPKEQRVAASRARRVRQERRVGATRRALIHSSSTSSSSLLHGASASTSSPMVTMTPLTASSTPQALDAKVYRPLLFHSRGYASSELYHDSYEMRARMHQQTQLLANNNNNNNSNSNAQVANAASGCLVHTEQQQPLKDRNIHHIDPVIRLETLSSRATSAVLWITYSSFLLALLLPYLQREGYLSTLVSLPGNVCAPHEVEPCTRVDSHRQLAKWSAFVNNVSLYAGSAQLRMKLHDVVNASDNIEFADLFEQKQHAHQRNQSAKATNSATNLTTSDQSSLTLMDESFELLYDFWLYGVDLHSSPPHTKEWIFSQKNRTVWVNCHGNSCQEVPLVDVSQRFETLGGSSYSTYLVIVLYKGIYPNVYARNVTYEFDYTKPAIHISEVMIRSLCLVFTLVFVPFWYLCVVNSCGSWQNMLPVQKWVLAMGIVLMVWQNPIYALTLWSHPSNVSLRTKFVANTCEAAAESFLYVFLLNLFDRQLTHSGGALSMTGFGKMLFGIGLFGIDLAMILVPMPLYWFAQEIGSEFTTSQTANLLMSHTSMLYATLGLLRMLLLVVWFVWFCQIAWYTANHLKKLPYMATRFEQLSYRFLLLQTWFFVLDVMVNTLVQTLMLLQQWLELGLSNAFFQNAAQIYASFFTCSNPNLGKFLFVSVVVYLIMFVHLPPRADDEEDLAHRSRLLLASTAFHVEERSHVDEYGFLVSDSSMFCVETACWLLELAIQAYFDPVGKRSASGFGELELERFGFELVSYLRRTRTDTHGIIALNLQKQRLVIAFRGSASRQNWKSNLRFDQQVVWIKQRCRGVASRNRTASCVESLKRLAARIPLLNMALPRVHRGFWQAYETIREELKDTVRLVLDEHPGVSVYITGHSMGAALAVLAAYDLAANYNIHVHMYNFGGPRVGNPSFVRLYNKAVPTSYRVVMDGDIVPGIPCLWGLYEHVGTEVTLDREGNLIVDPSFVEQSFHVSAKHRVSNHPTDVYSSSMAKCLENLQF